MCQQCHCVTRTRLTHTFLFNQEALLFFSEGEAGSGPGVTCSETRFTGLQASFSCHCISSQGFQLGAVLSITSQSKLRVSTMPEQRASQK